MHEELVERRRWISENRFLHALNYCMVLPGPEAQQLATYIGWLMHRTWGGIVAGGLFVLPSLFILIALSWVYMAFGNVPRGRGHLLRHQAGGDRDRRSRGLAHRLARAEERLALGHRRRGVRRHLRVERRRSRSSSSSPASSGTSAAASRRTKFAAGGGHGKADKAFGAALIDDDTPTPAHALFTWPRFARVLAVCGVGSGRRPSVALAAGLRLGRRR